MKEQAATNHTPDHGNRLTKIDNPSGDDYVYEYDGDGMRVRSGHDSGQGNVWNTRFYYDVVPSVYAYLFESDDAKNMTVAYTIDRSGSLISQRRGGSTYYHHYDALGSTRLLTDSSQTITDTYDYYAFGEIQSSSASTTNPFKFVGRLGYYDDPTTPFQYLRARYYAAQYGRFCTVDRGGGWYWYSANDPLGAVDPSGLGFQCTNECPLPGYHYDPNAGYCCPDSGMGYPTPPIPTCTWVPDPPYSPAPDPLWLCWLVPLRTPGEPYWNCVHRCMRMIPGVGPWCDTEIAKALSACGAVGGVICRAELLKGGVGAIAKKWACPALAAVPAVCGAMWLVCMLQCAQPPMTNPPPR